MDAEHRVTLTPSVSHSLVPASAPCRVVAFHRIQWRPAASFTLHRCTTLPFHEYGKIPAALARGRYTSALLKMCTVSPVSQLLGPAPARGRPADWPVDQKLDSFAASATRSQSLSPYRASILGHSLAHSPTSKHKKDAKYAVLASF